jgi:hypothetical protein
VIIWIYERGTIIAVHQFLRMKVGRWNAKEHRFLTNYARDGQGFMVSIDKGYSLLNTALKMPEKHLN